MELHQIEIICLFVLPVCVLVTVNLLIRHLFNEQNVAAKIVQSLLSNPMAIFLAVLSKWMILVALIGFAFVTLYTAFKRRGKTHEPAEIAVLVAEKLKTK